MLNRFVLVRIVNINGIDIARIQFDYDLVFAVVFMHANGEIYGRYGGRTPWNSESRVSLDGLKHSMRQVIRAHDPAREPSAPAVKTVFARDLLSSKRSCMHCHEVWEGIRSRQKEAGNFDPQSLFVYPRPENVGLTMEVDRGDHVAGVRAKSAAAEAGLQTGDRIGTINEMAVYSEADVAWALHNAPATGQIPIHFTRDGKARHVLIALKAGWKEGKLSWRASMRKEQLPSRR